MISQYKIKNKRYSYYSWSFVMTMTIVLCSLCCLTCAAQTKRALLIGISNYPPKDDNSWNNIHGENDISLLLPTLKEQGFKIRNLQEKMPLLIRLGKNLQLYHILVKKEI